MLENVRQNHDSFTGNQCLVKSIFGHNSTGCKELENGKVLVRYGLDQ